MPSRERILRAHLQVYLDMLKREQRSKDTLDRSEWVIETATAALEAAGSDPAPADVSEAEIDYLRNSYWAAVLPTTRRRYLGMFGTFLEWHGNPIVRRMRIPRPLDDRVNVDWLTPEQSFAVIEAAQGMERIVVHLESSASG